VTDSARQLLMVEDIQRGLVDLAAGDHHFLSGCLMGEWQPIETAPRDGSNVLATWADSWPKSPHVEAVYFSEGDWFYSYDGDMHSRPPTHWQPLLPLVLP